MHRILLFGDLHYSVDSLPEEKRWYPEIVSLLGFFADRMARWFLRFCDRHTHRCFDAFATVVARRQFDDAICVGDMTPGELESGLLSEKSRLEAVATRDRVETVLKRSPHYILGNHDVGYCAAIGHKQGGASHESLRAALAIYHIEPFYVRTIGEYDFIFITSTLLEFESIFSDLMRQQFDFLREALSQSRKCFLVVHSPFVFRNTELRALVNGSKNIEAVICGDTHHPLIGALVAKRLRILPRVISVPAVIGFLGFGRGVVELTLDGDSCRVARLRS